MLSIISCLETTLPEFFAKHELSVNSECVSLICRFSGEVNVQWFGLRTQYWVFCFLIRLNRFWVVAATISSQQPTHCGRCLLPTITIPKHWLNHRLCELHDWFLRLSYRPLNRYPFSKPNRPRIECGVTNSKSLSSLLKPALWRAFFSHFTCQLAGIGKLGKPLAGLAVDMFLRTRPLRSHTLLDYL